MVAPSSLYGIREHPVTGKTTKHNGVDFPATIGTPIYANKELTVEFAGQKSGYGNVVIAKDNTDTQYVFAHLDSVPNVKPGDSVPPGSLVGNAGNSGMSTGPHLHYETRQYDPNTGRWSSFDPITTIDPTTGRPYVNNASFTPGSNPAQSSLRSSNGKPDVDYSPNRSVAQAKPSTPATPTVQGKKPTVGPTKEAAAGIAPDNPLNGRRAGTITVSINPVLKLGDE